MDVFIMLVIHCALLHIRNYYTWINSLPTTLWSHAPKKNKAKRLNCLLLKMSYSSKNVLLFSLFTQDRLINQLKQKVYQNSSKKINIIITNDDLEEKYSYEVLLAICVNFSKINARVQTNKHSFLQVFYNIIDSTSLYT